MSAGQHRDTGHGPWLWASKAAIDRAAIIDGEGAGPVAVYIALCYAESDAPPSVKGGFYASAKKLGRYVGLGERTVERSIRKLEQAGLVQIISGRRSEKPNEANIYRLLNIGERSATLTERSVNDSGQCGGHKRNIPKGYKRKAPPSGSCASRTPGRSEGKNSGWDINDFPDPAKGRSK
jgi:DNA-binding transcriptional ArsR family regulator